MGIIIGILTVILVLLCIFLVLIILMQKSKQEAGLGAAFGGAATEQIFGAGTTSILTKATVWATALFFVVTLILAIIYSHQHTASILNKVGTGTNEPPALIEAPSTNTTPVAATTSNVTAAVSNTVESVAKEATAAAPALTETNAPATK